MGGNRSKPFSINIFLPDGDPEGLRIITKSNWTGCGVYCPRALFPEIKGRDEFSRTGVYVLIGAEEGGELPALYVGQADTVRARLESHHSGKDFWTKAVFFVSKDESLNKAHALHMEARLIQLAKEAKRAVLDNRAESQPPKLSEADKADAESFLQDVLNILPIVGISVFEQPKAAGGGQRLLYLKGKGVAAQGYEASSGFVVKKGSGFVTDAVRSIHPYMAVLRGELCKQGVIAEGERLAFAQDYEFTSPSLAAAVVLGRTANGRIEWKDKKGITLKEIQEKAAQGK